LLLCNSSSKPPFAVPAALLRLLIIVTPRSLDKTPEPLS